MSEAGRAESARWPMKKNFDYIKREYYEAILRSGGIPVLLPNVVDKREAGVLAGSVHGLLVTGGLDIHPRYFGQRPHARLTRTTDARDNFEIEAIRTALRNGIPVLGICRGHQVLNVALGGDLYQDLSCLKRRTIRHADPRQTGRVFHEVRILPGSLLYEIVGKETIEVNSSHHQVIDNLGRGLRAVAFAPDGIIEGFEVRKNSLVLGVQWHPEGIFERGHSRKLFAYFVRESGRHS